MDSVREARKAIDTQRTVLRAELALLDVAADALGEVLDYQAPKPKAKPKAKAKGRKPGRPKGTRRATVTAGQVSQPRAMKGEREEQVKALLDEHPHITPTDAAEQIGISVQNFHGVVSNLRGKGELLGNAVDPWIVKPAPETNGDGERDGDRPLAGGVT